ncbi:hypothetical protein L7F22_012683 [Adiantum nelumboides]|nr:hypothetical protein [Adiantum nelumboides]
MLLSRSMNASRPSAVVHGPASSNVALACSPCSRLSSGGCALSWSSAVVHPSFFHIPHRRRKHSTKPVFVVKGSSSTFEGGDERVRHGSQTAKPARRHVTKGRVSWSPDGQATILWGAQNHQDNVSRLKEKQQSGKAQEDRRSFESSGNIGSQFEPPALSVGVNQNSFPWQNEQRVSRTISNRPSSPSRQQSEIFNPLSASRLLTGSSAVKQASEVETHGASISSVEGAATLILHNEDSQFQSGARMHEATPYKQRAACTVAKRPSSRSRRQSEFFNPSSAARLLTGSPAVKQAAEVEAHGATISFVKGAATQTDNSQSYEGAFMREAPPHKEETPQARSVFTSKLEEILNNFRTRQKGEDVWKERTKEKHRDVPFEGDSVPSDPFSLTSKVFVRGNSSNHETAVQDVEASEYSFATPKSRKFFPRGERSFITGKQNVLGNERDYKPLKPVNSSPATPWGVKKERFPVSSMPSPGTKGSSTFVESRPAKSDRLQYKARKSFPESKTSVWVADKKTSLSSGKHSESLYEGRMDQNVNDQQFIDEDVETEDSVDLASNVTSDSEADGTYPSQSEIAEERKQAASKTSVSRSLIQDMKACWHSDSVSSLPFEIQYSYSETPNAPVIRYRESPYSPFGPSSLSRPWMGGPPRKKSKKNLPLFDSFNPPPKGKKGIKPVQDPGPYRDGQGPKPAKSRDEILGEPLNAQEIAELVDCCQNESRQLNLGRDGLTHNMLDLVHTHWKRRRVIKVRCLGVPTVDMDNVCFHLEKKTGGKIIHRSGGVAYLFRGRNYNYKDRPEIPLMLWKPLAPVYPKLIKRTPEGLTEEEAIQLRLLGKKIEPLCTLGKNGVYINLVNDVRAAFKVDDLVRINCCGLNPSDYKKIGAKLKDLVPCVLLSFDDEQILMWKGKETPTIVNSMKGSEAAEGFMEESSVSSVESIFMSTNVDSVNAALAIDGSLTSLALDDSHISHPESSLEDFKNRVIKAGSEVNNPFHTVLAAQDELNLDDSNIVVQDTRQKVENDTTHCLEEEKALPDATCCEKGEYRDSNLLAEDQDRGVATLQTAFALESRSTNLGSRESVEASEEACIVVHVDDLWDQAIASGIAIQIENEVDNDIVVKKVRELAKAAPVGEVYTRQLMRLLEPKKQKIDSPEKEMHKHIKNIRRMRLEKKLSKRSYRMRTADVPKELPEDGPRCSGMPVDELARLLSIR